MNKIAQNSALDIVSAAMEKTGYVCSPIGIEVNLADIHHRDHLNFLLTVAEMGIQEGAKRTADEWYIAQDSHLNYLMGLATQKHDVRNSGTTTRIATALALYAMTCPNQIVKAEDTYKKDVAHSHVAELACCVLQALGVPYRRVDNRSFVVISEPIKN